MTDPPRTSFHLYEENWIQVRELDGTIREVGIREAFRSAHRLHSVVGELPTTTLAITRMLLAILHRAVRAEDPVQDWIRLWEAAELPEDKISTYLDSVVDRFDLLHPSTPFLQVADLHTNKGETTGLERIIADVPNNAPFFTTRGPAARQRISYAEAARWLVHSQAFDPSGIKSGAVGDDRVKGGKGYPIGVSWVGNLGCVLIEGSSLRETLLFNLVLAPIDAPDYPWPESDLPVWERDALSPAEEDRDEYATGPADVLSWPSRRIRLQHDGEAITGVLLCNGDALSQQNRFAETMTTWRRSETQEKKLGHRVYMPRSHDPARSLWRSMSALLPQTERSTAFRDGAAVPSANLEWLGLMRASGALSDDFVVRTRAIGMTYGSQSSVVEEVVDDSLDIHTVLVSPDGRALARAALDAVSAADSAVSALANLARNLVISAGGDPAGGASDRAREHAYFVLDTPFRQWVAELREQTDSTAALFDWFDIARPLIRASGAELVEQAGPSAWVGRENNQGKHVDTGQAEAWFNAAVRKALPYSIQDDGAEAEVQDSTLETV